MSELLQQSLEMHNFPATLLLLLCLGYWLLVLFGALSVDSLDGSGAAPGLEVEGEVAGGESGWLQGLASFFNLVEVPVILFLSVCALVWWFLQVVLDHAWNAGNAAGTGLVLLGGTFVVSLFAAKFLVAPLKPLFKRLNQGEEPLELVGREALVKSGEVSSRHGQVEVAKEGAPLLLHARVLEDEAPLPKGSTVIIYREDRDRGIVFVKSIER